MKWIVSVVLVVGVARAAPESAEVALDPPPATRSSR